jgi:hypothetical protein
LENATRVEREELFCGKNETCIHFQCPNVESREREKKERKKRERQE